MPGTTDIGNHGDDTVTTVALPFPFTLYDQSFTSVNLSSNGNAQFTTTDATFTNQCLPWTTHNYTIYPYWDDLYLVNSGFGIFTSISGTAPNRIFNIEWRAQYFPGSGSAGFELRLYEGQLRFDVIYGTVSERQHIGHSRSAERQHVLYSVLLQRLRRRGDWRTKLCLYPGTLPNSYAICHSESNSHIHANAYTNGHSHGNCYCYIHAYANGYSYGHIHSDSYCDWLRQHRRLRLLLLRPRQLHRGLLRHQGVLRNQGLGRLPRRGFRVTLGRDYRLKNCSD